MNVAEGMLIAIPRQFGAPEKSAKTKNSGSVVEVISMHGNGVGGKQADAMNVIIVMK